jgi:hypothetical protein
MGSGVAAFALAIPMFFLVRWLVAQYRDKIMARFENTKFWKAMKATGFYKWYVKYEEFRG